MLYKASIKNDLGNWQEATFFVICRKIYMKMRTAILSDIHGNFEALKEVLRDIEHEGINDIICLGDLIGYGAQPQEVVELIMKNNIPSVKGNHDWGLGNPDKLGWFNPAARKSILKTENLLNKTSKDWLDQLPSHLVHNSCRMVHGTPPSSFLKYIVEYDEAGLIEVFRSFKEPITFVGHTHLLGLYTLESDTIIRQLLLNGEKMLKRENRYIVNVGSIGQPRDNDERAKYVIYNDE